MTIYRGKSVVISVILCSYIGLTGCASNYLNDWSINNDPTLPKEIINFPPLYEVTEGDLGRTLAAWGVSSDRPAIELLEPWRFKDETFVVSALIMKAGIGKLSHTMTHVKTNVKWDCFTFNFFSVDSPTADMGVRALCRDNRGNFKNLNQLLHPKIPWFRPFDVEYIETTVKELNGPTDVQEFVYNGRVGDAVKFIYREYKNNYARPAFSQEVQYDLSQSDEIGFQNLRMKVINATNTSITYIVLRNF